MRIGACQTPEIIGDVERALSCVEDFAAEAAERGVDLMLFPEGFLQGYLVEEAHLREHGLALDSAEFAAVLRRLAPVAPTLVFGVIERNGGRYFNSAVVVEGGELRGVYRKTHLVAGEALFEAGDAYPTFVAKGVRFGVNICYDTRFAEAAAPVAAQGARLLLVPAQNMMRREVAPYWKDRHHAIRAERVRETGMWLASADVTGERGDTHVGWGPTSVIAPDGEVVARVALGEVGMAVAEVGERSGPSRLSRRP
ncbi:MAG TPA: carbon-nitrogen hydrolase family protein [Phytomonospora sp.]